ncbi:MTH1187 family thiamine-binding protein [Alicyclobacillus fastidiosus]|uniref:MTH1187 family thiamine-binding protein n=1 Tax=Alicyclobacillus fastidiosus TaxID=392011 RepID=A0ABV5ALD7_9BACL|nr:MTH1187 family thiamine-binding protein [Alicyclobacillus fastidiosus]WEH08865.1 MTH1187 family thiamine-binding protein [Alicyclobacillus fastidiosus]
MPLLEINIVPVGTNSSSFSSHVGQALKLIEGRGLKYQVTPTSTVIEGDLSDLMDVAKEIHEEALHGATRVVTNITIDQRMDKAMDMENSVQSAQQSLQ